MRNKRFTLQYLKSQCRDAAMGELPWEILLGNICDWLEGDRAMMLSAHYGQPYSSTVSYNHDLSKILKYNKEFNGSDPRMPFSKLTMPGQTRTGQQYVRNEDIKDTEYFNVISRAGDQLDSLHSVIMDTPGSGRQAISIHRSFKNNLFELSDVDNMNALLPHLTEAYQYAVKVSGKLSTKIGSRDCALLVKPDLQSKCLSGDPFNIFSGNEFLGWNGDYLRPKNEALQKFLVLTMRRARKGVSSQCRLRVNYPSETEVNPFIQITIFPRPKLIDWLSDTEGAVMLYATRLEENTDTSNCDIFSKIYRLTKSEFRTLKALLETNDLKMAALKSEVTYETVRWHLKNIFQKTGYNKQETLLKAVIEMDLSNSY